MPVELNYILYLMSQQIYAPKDGRCFSCRKQLLNDERVVEALIDNPKDRIIITNCPYCHRSYVE